MHTFDFNISHMPPPLRGLYFAWSSATANGKGGNLNKLTLSPLSRDLDRLILTEVFRDPQGEITDFQFLYVSTAYGKAMGESVCGKRLSALSGKGPATEIWEAYRTIANRPEPMFVSLPYVGPLPGCSRTQELFLPAHDPETNVEYIMNGVLLSDPVDSLKAQLEHA
jgi:hypothetical protein